MTTPTRAPLMPEPFGYVSDGFPDGLHFQHKPWPELHQLTHSVAAVYSAAQLVQAIEDAKAAGREQGLREAKEVCEALSTKVYDHAKPPYLSCAAAASLREAAQNALVTLDGIADTNPRDTADFETPAEWIAWAKSRARWAADALRSPVAKEIYAERIARAQAQGQLLPPEPVAAPEQQAMEL